MTTSATPVAFVHGFTQTPASWRPVADEFAGQHPVRVVEVPFHSPHAPRVSTFDEGCDALLVEDEPVVLVGYSMGARLALGAAVRRPERVAGLVLLGCNPGITDPDERRRRAADDEQLARRVLEVGTSAFLDEWMDRPMFAGLPESARAGRDAHDPADLAAALRVLGVGTQPDLWPFLGGLNVPTLALAGSRDDAFVGRAVAIARAIGAHAESESIADAGHAAHLERHDEFVATLRRWLQRHFPD